MPLYVGVLATMFSPDTCKLPSLSRLADNVVLALEDDLPERIQNGTEITFACTDGYALTKGGVLTCREDGIWQGILLECARKLRKCLNNAVSCVVSLWKTSKMVLRKMRCSKCEYLSMYIPCLWYTLTAAKPKFDYNPSQSFQFQFCLSTYALYSQTK